MLLFCSIAFLKAEKILNRYMVFMQNIDGILDPLANSLKISSFSDAFPAILYTAFEVGIDEPGSLNPSLPNTCNLKDHSPIPKTWHSKLIYRYFINIKALLLIAAKDGFSSFSPAHFFRYVHKKYCQQSKFDDTSTNLENSARKIFLVRTWNSSCSPSRRTSIYVEANEIMEEYDLILNFSESLCYYRSVLGLPPDDDSNYKSSIQLLDLLQNYRIFYGSLFRLIIDETLARPSKFDANNIGRHKNLIVQYGILFPYVEVSSDCLYLFGQFFKYLFIYFNFGPVFGFFSTCFVQSYKVVEVYVSKPEIGIDLSNALIVMQGSGGPLPASHVFQRSTKIALAILLREFYQQSENFIRSKFPGVVIPFCRPLVENRALGYFRLFKILAGHDSSSECDRKKGEYPMDWLAAFRRRFCMQFSIAVKVPVIFPGVFLKNSLVPCNFISRLKDLFDKKLAGDVQLMLAFIAENPLVDFREFSLEFCVQSCLFESVFRAMTIVSSEADLIHSRAYVFEDVIDALMNNQSLTPLNICNNLEYLVYWRMLREFRRADTPVHSLLNKICILEASVRRTFIEVDYIEGASMANVLPVDDVSIIQSCLKKLISEIALFCPPLSSTCFDQALASGGHSFRRGYRAVRFLRLMDSKPNEVDFRYFLVTQYTELLESKCENLN